MKYIVVKIGIYTPDFIPQIAMLERWDNNKCLGVSYLPRHFTQNDIDNAINKIESEPERVVPRG